MSELTNYLTNENNQLHRRVRELEWAIADVLGRLGARENGPSQYLAEVADRIERDLRKVLDS